MAEPNTTAKKFAAQFMEDFENVKDTNGNYLSTRDLEYLFQQAIDEAKRVGEV